MKGKEEKSSTNSSFIESIKESSVVMKHYVLHGKCNNTPDKYKDLKSIVKKHKKKKGHKKCIGQESAKFSNWKILKNLSRTRKQGKWSQKLYTSDNKEGMKNWSSKEESVESEEVSISSSEWKIGLDREIFTTWWNNGALKISKPIIWLILF